MNPVAEPAYAVAVLLVGADFPDTLVRPGPQGLRPRAPLA